MQTQVATLQHHLVRLTLELLQEQTADSEQRLRPLEALVSQTLGPLHAPQQTALWRVFLMPPLLQSVVCCLPKCEPVHA